MGNGGLLEFFDCLLTFCFSLFLFFLFWFWFWFVFSSSSFKIIKKMFNIKFKDNTNPQEARANLGGQ